MPAFFLGRSGLIGHKADDVTARKSLVIGSGFRLQDHCFKISSYHQ
jgi:hypothetical protein